MNFDPVGRRYLTHIFDKLPSRGQFFVRRSYDKMSAAELRVIRTLLDTGIIPTLNRSDLASRSDIDYFRYDKEEQHTFIVPYVSQRENIIKKAIRSRADWRNQVTKIHDINNLEYSVKCHEPFVAELTDVTIFGPHALVQTATGELPLEIKANIRSPSGGFDGMFRSTLRWFGRFNTAKTMVWSDTPDKHFEVATSILTGRKNTTPAYGHWLVEILPRIRGIKHYQEQTGRQPEILVNPNITHWQMKMLGLVGVDQSDIRKWKGGTAAVDRYVLPKWSKSEWCVSDIEWVREQIRSRVNYEEHLGRFSSRIFLSREDMDRRQILNRNEIIDTISEYGFKTYTPESLTFPEQVALFQDAEILIGPTGGSFTNMVFADDVDVIEIFQPDHFITWFFELASILGHDYYPVFGDAVNKNSSQNSHHRDFTVSPNQVITVLDEIV